MVVLFTARKWLQANLLRNYAKEIGATFLSLSEDWVWR